MMVKAFGTGTAGREKKLMRHGWQSKDNQDRLRYWLQ
jgi:hypothetical protein